MWMSPLHLAGLPAVKRLPMFWVCSFVQQQNANQSMQHCIMTYLDLQVFLAVLTKNILHVPAGLQHAQ